MKGILRITPTPTLDELAEKDGLGLNCKLCHSCFVYYTVHGMTESKGNKEMLEHWKDKHAFELSVLVHGKDTTAHNHK